MMRAGRLLLVALLLEPLTLLPARADNLSDVLNKVLQQPGANQALSNNEIAAGIKEALANGTRAAVNELGRPDGFWGNARFRIPLPGPVEKAQGVLRAAGMGAQVDQLHLTINRAAEQAVPVAADVFADAVRNLTVNDARQILDGPPDAATRYFERTTSATLTAKFEPIVADVTSRLGLVQEYDQLMASTGPVAGLLGVNPDLNAYVTRKALSALYVCVGEEERSIRRDPAARTTDLLKKVFGAH